MIRAISLWWAQRKATKPPKMRAPNSNTLRAKRKELEEAQLALLGTLSSQEYAEAMSNWHRTRIARLSGEIELEEKYLQSLVALEAETPTAAAPAPLKPNVPFTTRVSPFNNPMTVANKAINDHATSVR